MLETFYVYRGKEDNYQLRLEGSHMTMSTSTTEEGIFDCLETIVKRYKSKATLERKLRDIEQYRPSESTIKMKEKEYLECEEYREKVRRVVRASLKTVKEESTPKLIGKNTIKILPTNRSKPKPKIETEVRSKKKKIGLITI